jgi:predicted O-linked N-acetylglucosamine transferase (SPINDLY family)
VLAAQAGHNQIAVDLINKALAIQPDDAEAYVNLGNALCELQRLTDGIVAFRKAIKCKPDFAVAYNNLANALSLNGELGEAISCYRTAIELKPNYPEAQGNLIYVMQFHPGCDAQAIAEEHRRWDRVYGEPRRRLIRPHSNDRTPERRLRIGYVSPDFRNHVVGRNLIPLLREHDRANFEITCYSQALRTDKLTAQFRRYADRWRDIGRLPDDELAAQIREDQIDILMDLALHMDANRVMVFAHKPAPVQMTFAGYPASTGLTAIDYRVSDPYLDPPGIDESVYSEKTIRLPCSFWCYDPLDTGDVPINPLPALLSGCVTFGCLNNSMKVNDQLLDLWARVLREIEGSRLMLLGMKGTHQQKTADRLLAAGIEPGRIEFVPHQSRQRYLEVYHRIDLGLDSFPYNGHTTSLDSLWMGVPVVTLVGERPVSRGGWSQLSNLGLTELAAQSTEEFVAIAIRLAEDLPRLGNLRETLRGRLERSPLMDAPRFTRDIESAYRQAWRDWCATD